ncbi:sulfurtransferase [Ktedonobacter sp. SOSP1-52]|uniref:rhodanese-like domain-containing protein n=1 Tax=Ktedonobacter sp. SOSP1-52 TaxID=2778366 RepID=UPI001915D05A|nr:rhodanese-like domain-containing protein [Ktedonobacter sp. SOSP1-52]GHO63258.1 sulfurtransferase [Ktedonobacter sp. SOSP1-52]
MNPESTSTTIVPVEKAYEMIMVTQDAIVLDVRTPAEFESKHIPGSHNIPLDQLPASTNEIAKLASNASLLLICQSGTRARKAAEVLQTVPVSSLALLDGGIVAWEKAGKPCQLGVQKWSMERQVRGVAGTLVLLGALGGLFAWKPLTWIAVLIGGGLAYSAASNTCGMALLLSKLPYNQGAVCDVRQTLKNMADAAQ